MSTKRDKVNPSNFQLGKTTEVLFKKKKNPVIEILHKQKISKQKGRRCRGMHLKKNVQQLDQLLSV